MFIIDITAHERNEVQSSGDAALLTVRTVFQMIGHLYSVLRHNQLSDFLSLPQFFFEQFAVFICIGEYSSS